MNDPLDCDWIRGSVYRLARKSKRYRRRIEACCDREVIRPLHGSGTLNLCAHPRMRIRVDFVMAHYANIVCKRPGVGWFKFDREDPPETFADAKPRVYTAEDLCEMYGRATAEPKRPKDPVYVCSPTALSKLKAWYRHSMGEQAEQG